MGNATQETLQEVKDALTTPALPSGAATETTLAALNTKMPTAAAPGDSDSGATTMSAIAARMQAWTGAAWKRLTLGQAARTASVPVAVASQYTAPASMTLPGSPAGTLTSSYAAASSTVDVPSGALVAIFEIQYTGGTSSSGGVASHKVLIGDGTYQATGPDGTYSVIAGVTAAAAATSKYTIGPVDVRGSSKVNLSSAETGDTSHCGLIAVSVAFG